MADRRLRDRERRQRLEGAGQAAVSDPALLRQRLRSGRTTRERLRLAAYLEHPGAQEALGDEAPWTLEEARQVLELTRASAPVFERTWPGWENPALPALEWVCGLLPFGLEPVARVAVAAAAHGVPRAGLLAPLRRAARDPGAGLERPPAGPGLAPWQEALLQRAAQAVAHACDPAPDLPRAVIAAVEALQEADRGEGWPALRAAAAAELLPWALGERDPLASPQLLVYLSLFSSADSWLTGASSESR